MTRKTSARTDMRMKLLLKILETRTVMAIRNARSPDAQGKTTTKQPTTLTSETSIQGAEIVTRVKKARKRAAVDIVTRVKTVRKTVTVKGRRRAADAMVVTTMATVPLTLTRSADATVIAID